jgi:hypothetical protein
MRRVDLVGKGPILFEGRELPYAAKQFDLVPFWQTLPNETKEWLWDLHYCWGRTRRLRSRRIARHVKLVRENLNAQRASAIERLRRALPEASQAELEEMIADWHRSLDLIEEIARQQRSCEWTITASDESLEENLRLVIGMARMAGAFDSPPGVEFRVRNLPREEQLKWMASVSDALSGKKRKWWQHFLDGWRGGWHDDREFSH